MRYTLCVVARLPVSCSATNPPRHYVEIITDSSDFAISMNAAVPRSNAWEPIHLNGIVEGEYIGHVTVAMSGDHGCVYDAPVEFAHQGPLLIGAVNAYRSHRRDVGHAWRLAASLHQ